MTCGGSTATAFGDATAKVLQEHLRSPSDVLILMPILDRSDMVCNRVRWSKDCGMRLLIGRDLFPRRQIQPTFNIDLQLLWAFVVSTRCVCFPGREKQLHMPPARRKLSIQARNSHRGLLGI